MNIGNKEVIGAYIGSQEVDKIYLGEELVYGTVGNNFTVEADTSTCSLNSGNLTDFAGGSSTIVLDVINQNTPKVKLSLRSPSVLYSDIKTISFTTSLSGNTRYLGAFWGYYDASGTYVYKGEAPSVSAGVMTYSNVSIPQDATGILICTNNYGANTTGVTNTVSNLQILDANGNSLL